MALVHQLDASVIGTMFSDTGKSTQITDGGAVAAWAAPNGTVTTDALQSTVANRPLYRANYNSSGYPGLQFDGSNDQMSIAHSSGWNATIIDLFIVLNSASASGYRGIVNKWVDANWNGGWGAVYAAGVLYSGAPTWNNAGASAVVGSRILMHMHFEGGKTGIDQGTSVYGGSQSGAGPANNTASLFIGNAPNGVYPFSGAIHEIRVYTGGETDQFVFTLKNSLRKKWGLPFISEGYYSPFSNPVLGV